MPNVKVNIEIFCDCGEGLCNQSVGGDGSITVSPCERCMEKQEKCRRLLYTEVTNNVCW
jgi:hypothetical protein